MQQRLKPRFLSRRIANHAKRGKFLWDKINYIHNNPVASGLVKNPQDWIYSSAANYYGEEGILEVEIILPRLIAVN